jgi:hypothetical protein
MYFFGNMTFKISFITITYNLDSQLILEKWYLTILNHNFEEHVDCVEQRLYRYCACVRIVVYVCDCDLRLLSIFVEEALISSMLW